MPDTQDGGTPEEKTYSEAEVTALRESAKKEGQTESWRHFQSEADKQIAKARSEAGTRETELTGQINTLKSSHLESLPAEERRNAMVEELYKERFESKPASGTPGAQVQTPDPEPDPAQYAAEMQGQIKVALKDLGIDPDKVDWGEGKSPGDSLKTFLGSVLAQSKFSESKDPAPKNNQVDTARGAGDSLDLTKVDPKELITRNAWVPIRGMMEE